jgi:poly-gamma-glutamate synthesis protein (capsule biosynthesis protein)
MAQALCDMGIDVIVGNHAHVPQPIDLLTSTTDENQKTLCLYSMGNSVHNIFGTKYPKQTEDGMLFSVTFAKYSDGTVVLESADVLPTWVYRYYENDVRRYRVLTMDRTDKDNWKTKMNLTDDVLASCQASYDHTMAIVGSGLDKANTYYAQNQKDVENLIGVKN